MWFFNDYDMPQGHIKAVSDTETRQMFGRREIFTDEQNITAENVVSVLMKAVPSIHVFAVNIQLKVIIAFLILVTLAQPMADFIERLMGIMWQNLYGLLGILGG